MACVNVAGEFFEIFGSSRSKDDIKTLGSDILNYDVMHQQGQV